MTDNPKLILFVCTGNVCRSPMAEFLFRHRVGPDAGWTTESAGVLAARGVPASAPAVEVMGEWGIDLRPHQSQPLTEELAGAAELIVVMTEQHRQDVLRLLPSSEGRVFLLSEFGVSRSTGDIPDPIGQPVGVYRTVRDQVESAISDLILHLMEQGRLRLVSPARGPDLRIALGADHGGFELKESLRKHLQSRSITVEDVGCHSTEPVDYPDYAIEVARRVFEGRADQGILICTTGIGMSIAANKFPRVRAALCTTPHMAALARAHNHANVLALGAEVVSHGAALAILEEWLKGRFEAGTRHERRVGKIQARISGLDDPIAVYDGDSEIYAVLRDEARRQRDYLELVASENYTSRAIREAMASVLTNKYAEGYPGKRWYPGCERVDVAEEVAIDRAKALFGAEHANVQPYSGSSANMAALFAMLSPGDTFLAMDMAHGGHLTHGQEHNFSGRLFHAVHYGVDPQSERLDYNAIQALAQKHRPKLICAGASSYSRLIDFKRMRSVADSVGAYLLVDMAHIAGLVAAGCHPNPVPHADVVTTTTHKTLRGPRGGMILCRQALAQDIDRQVFPGLQGGPLMHGVAAKAICLHEAGLPAFRAYGQQVVRNAKALAAALEQAGLRIVSGGTDNHLLVADLSTLNVTGKDAAAALLAAGFTVNKHAIPFDKQSPFVTSGIRLGTPAVTTRGMTEAEMETLAALIVRVLGAPKDKKAIERIREESLALAAAFPPP